MTKHYCHRCGLEHNCNADHKPWHPGWTVATMAFVALPAFIFMVAVLGTYPWTGVLVLLLMGAGFGFHFVDREYNRRKALQARADWDYRAGLQ